ncbi:type II toxin-antitoxin system VapC family toxin [Frankia sp. CNm7]|uniref:Ribonuclease VapC n=1 Tax=Frankia nepalensis TaxID=1836974 RepID=A0A937RET5_9ACTN|nr:type II toxin-antitoxin system VapC family toxin [Frankia nepalensis]MBL7501864.1 type II toxin-antitoxin system VapC family toxin [Frankia nepalensis]MBL7513800.1 type II toxin-antitoxin system VapC family toxin [Frankia nepalensis]MBL7519985.1 type II toxin-antitoxin system VapC family toxin [Frankia nepalensis]MBL7629105.1 type II toxin-antitoxin system VapC family toxin [Frankia nepalensis]
MICYFDTSAFVSLLVDEPGTAAATRLWEAADRAVSSRLLYVEAAAALAQARRLGKLNKSAHETALTCLDELYANVDVVAVNDRVVARAATLSRQLSLRAYDAVHCAAAQMLASDDLVIASGDKSLLIACRTLGLATADTSVSV